MVVGQPIQYYTSYYLTPFREELPYFPHRREAQLPSVYYPPVMETTEYFMTPSSPNSIQSDSDNSVSSVEVSSKQIQLTNLKKEENRVQCCWRSCGLYFPSLEQLASHVSKVHSASGSGGLFYCGWEGCTRNNKGFNARYKMLVHVRTHTNEKPHQCTLCEKSFSRAENLKIHSRSHSGEKPYICPVPGCNKAYSNSSDRFKHTRTHSVEKPYQCKVPGCPKKYTDPSSLRKHVKTYKHFVNENETNQKSSEMSTTIIEQRTSVISETNDKLNESKHTMIGSSYDIYYNENVIRHPCNCKHLCQSNCNNRISSISRLDTSYNLKNDEKTMGWDQFLEPIIHEPKKLYKPYELECVKSMSMDVDLDVPLDLSIRRSI